MDSDNHSMSWEQVEDFRFEIEWSLNQRNQRNCLFISKGRDCFVFLRFTGVVSGSRPPVASGQWGAGPARGRLFRRCGEAGGGGVRGGGAPAGSSEEGEGKGEHGNGESIPTFNFGRGEFRSWFVGGRARVSPSQLRPAGERRWKEERSALRWRGDLEGRSSSGMDRVGAQVGRAALGWLGLT